MPIVTLKPEGQLTIPTEILQQWKVQAEQPLELTIHNNVVTIQAARIDKQPKDKRLNRFAGIGRGCWGETDQQVQANIQELRESWSR